MFADICPRTLSVPRNEQFSASVVQFEKNFELRGTDNVQGQISKDIFAANGASIL